DDFASEIQKRRAGFTALRGQINPQMGRAKITVQKFSIEAGHHSKAGRLRKIERITDRDDWRGDLDLLGSAQGKRRGRELDLQNRDAAAQVRQQNVGRIFFSIDLDRDVVRIAANRKSGVNRSACINEKAGAGELAVCIGPAELHYGLVSLFVSILTFAAARAGRVFLRASARIA